MKRWKRSVRGLLAAVLSAVILCTGPALPAWAEGANGQIEEGQQEAPSEPKDQGASGDVETPEGGEEPDGVETPADTDTSESQEAPSDSESQEAPSDSESQEAPSDPEEPEAMDQEPEFFMDAAAAPWPARNRAVASQKTENDPVLDIGNGMIVIYDGYYMQGKGHSVSDFSGEESNKRPYTGTITITGSTDEYGISVVGGSHRIRLRNASVCPRGQWNTDSDNGRDIWTSAGLSVLNGGKVELILEGNSLLKGSTCNGTFGAEPGIYVQNSQLDITGDGQLQTQGGSSVRRNGNMGVSLAGGSGILADEGSTVRIFGNARVTASGGNRPEEGYTDNLEAGEGAGVSLFEGSSLLIQEKGFLEASGGSSGELEPGSSLLLEGGILRGEGRYYGLNILSTSQARISGGSLYLMGQKNYGVNGLGLLQIQGTEADVTIGTRGWGSYTACCDTTVQVIPEEGFWAWNQMGTSEASLSREILMGESDLTQAWGRGGGKKYVCLTFFSQNQTYGLTLEDAGQGNQGDGSYRAGTEVPVKAGTKEGFRFLRWETLGSGSFEDAASPDTIFRMPPEDVTIRPVFGKLYGLKLGNGTVPEASELNFVAGEKVKLKADDRTGEGQVFDHWEIRTGQGSLENANEADTFYTMGAEDAEIAAVYVQGYELKVEGGSGSGMYAEGRTVQLRAQLPDGAEFAGWTVSGPGVLEDASGVATGFTMGSGPATITANFENVGALGDFVVTGGTPGRDYKFYERGGVYWTLEFYGSGDYTVRLREGVEQTEHSIRITDGAPRMTLQNVKISNKNIPFAIETDGIVTLVLDGENKLENTTKGGTYGWPALMTEKELVITSIQGNGSSYGSLTAATKGTSASGIGGMLNKGGGNIIIEGGTVTAQGGQNGAGIGSGSSESGNVIINGGTVTATGGNCGAGIGGGENGTGTVTITGGTVTASGGMYGAGIGGGKGGSGTVTITGGNITATGGDKAVGIGGGENAAGTVDIQGSPVIRQGSSSGSMPEVTAEDVKTGTLLHASVRYDDNGITGITLTPEEGTAYQNFGLAFEAELQGTGDRTVLWSVSGNNSSRTVVSQSGNLTVGADETARTVTVTAASAAKDTVKKSATVAILPVPITLTPEKATVTLGDSLPVTASVPADLSCMLQLCLDGTPVSAKAAPQDGKVTFTLGEEVLIEGEHSLTVRCFKDSAYIESSPVTVSVERPVPGILSWPTAGGITYGQALSESDLIGGAAQVPGTFAWAEEVAKPSAGTKAYAVVFTPEDSLYQQVRQEIEVTVEKAEPLLIWVSLVQTLDYTGKEAALTPPEVTLTAGESFTGTVSYRHRSSGDARAEWKEGLPKAAGSYEVKAVVAEQANYKEGEAVDTLLLTVRPISLTVQGLAAVNRDYNGQRQVELTGGSLTGILTGDQVALELPTYGTLDTPDVGTNKAVEISWDALAGEDAGNYTFAAPAVTADIGKAAPQVTVTAVKKSEDGLLNTLLSWFIGTYKDTIVLTAQVEKTGENAQIPAGSVVFTIDGEEGEPISLKNGCAVWEYQPGSGEHTVSARFQASPETNYRDSRTAAPCTFDIQKADLGELTIAGTPKFGETLTAQIKEPGGEDVLSFQWCRTREGQTEEIPGAVGNTYTLTEEEIGCTLTVTAQTNNYNNAVSAPTLQVEKADGPAAPADGRVDDEKDTFAFTPAPGMDWKEYEYSINGGDSWADVASMPIPIGDLALKAGELLVRAKETPTCKAGLSLANQEGFTERLKGRVSVSGNTVYGETLTAEVQAQPDARFHYQWKADGAAVGTDSPNYQIQGSDLGRQITVEVTAAPYAGALTASASGKTSRRQITVTADACSKFYGQADSKLTYQVGGEGLVEGDLLTGTLVREPGENAGAYAISQGSLAHEWYDISYTGADLTIEKASVDLRIQLSAAAQKVNKDVTITVTAQNAGSGQMEPSLDAPEGVRLAGPEGEIFLTAEGKGRWTGTYHIPDGAPSQVEFTATVEDPTGNYQDPKEASAVLAITEKGAVSLELTAEKEDHIIYGDQVTVTARVGKADAEDQDPLSGSLTFYLGEPAKGGRELGTIKGQTQKDPLGQEMLGASLTLDKKILTAGTHKVYVVYGDDPYFGEGSCGIGISVEKRQLLWDTTDLKASRQEGAQGEAAVTGALRVTGILDQEVIFIAPDAMETMGLKGYEKAGQYEVTVVPQGGKWSFDPAEPDNYELPGENPTIMAVILPKEGGGQNPDASTEPSGGQNPDAPTEPSGGQNPDASTEPSGGQNPVWRFPEGGYFQIAQGSLAPNREIIDLEQRFAALKQEISIPNQEPSVPDPEALAEIIQELEVPSASNEGAISTEPRQKAQRPAVAQPPLEKKAPAVIWWVVLAALAVTAAVAWIWLARKKRREE